MFLNQFVERSHVNLLQPSSKVTLAYLVSRGVTLEEIKKYKIGLTPALFANLNESEHSDAKEFNKWLGYKGKFVKNRLLFPIYDEVGDIRGIETRAIDKKAMSVLKPNFQDTLKDLIAKLPDNEVRYKKFYLEKNKFMAIFYGLPEALEEIWNTETVYMTEGIFDLLTLRKIKLNCLSPLTANITKYQTDWLKRYVKKIILLFDSDKKGKEATQKLKEELGDEIHIYSIVLKGKDVNDYVLNNGIRDFQYYLEDKLETFF